MLKSDKNICHCTCRPTDIYIYIYIHIYIYICTVTVTSHSAVSRIKVFQTKIVEKLKADILYSVNFLQNFTVYEIMWNNVLSGAGRRWDGACLLLVVNLRKQEHA